MRLEVGAIDAVSPRVGDIHRVTNAYDDRVSVSIHVYGADIGAVTRSAYDAEGRAKPFISQYADLPPWRGDRPRLRLKTLQPL